MTSTAASDWDSIILHGVIPTGKEIGRGAYGRVFEVNYEGTLCAAKEVHKELLQPQTGNGLQRIKEIFLRESQLWSTLHHPHVVRFLGVYYPAMDQYRLPVMVMEKMQHTLGDLMENYHNIPLNVKLSILDEVCLGLRYLHIRNLVHRDLTPNNVLLGRCLEAKITDLGTAKEVRNLNNGGRMSEFPGTADFMPPEACVPGAVYGPSLDVFSYGGMILNVTTQHWPHPTDREQLNPDTGRKEVVSEVKRRQQFLDKMTGGATDLKLLVMSCLNDNPGNRPPLVEISMTIKRIKDVCSQKSGFDGMSRIAWWAEVSGEQVTSSLIIALEEMTINNELLRKEVDALKTDNTQLKASNDTQKYRIKKLTDLLNKMERNKEDQIKQINSQRSDITKMRDEIAQLIAYNDAMKAENIQMKSNLKQQKKPTTTGDVFSRPVKINWEEGAHIPVGYNGHTAVWLNGLVYVGGGFGSKLIFHKPSYTIYFYDPVNNSWSSLFDVPYCLFAMTTWKNKLVIAGGQDASQKKTNQIFTTDDGQWKTFSKMITARAYATAAGYQEMLIITGGRDYTDTTLLSTEVFDSNTGQPYICADLPQPHYWLKSVIVDSMLYLLGGHNQYGKPSPTVIAAPLDTLSKDRQLKWNVYQDAPRCRFAPVSINGTLLILGGSNERKGTTDIYKLNNVSHSWEAIRSKIPLARSSLTAVTTDDGRIIIIGGLTDKGEVTDTVWISHNDMT